MYKPGQGRDPYHDRVCATMKSHVEYPDSGCKTLDRDPMDRLFRCPHCDYDHKDAAAMKVGQFSLLPPYYLG